MCEQTTAGIESAAEEVRGADLGDRRLSRRLVGIVQAVEKDPSKSFTATMVADADTEAFYRFLRNPRVSFEQVLEPHFAATRARAAETGQVVVIHDSTEVKHSSATPEGGFYRLKSETYGYLGHFSLCAAEEDGVNLRPLGLVHAEAVERNKTPVKGGSLAQWKNPKKESRRWGRGARTVKKSLGPEVAVIHVMDREGDSYEIISELVETGQDFLIRLKSDRRVSGAEDLRVIEAVERGEVILEREVRLSARGEDRPPQTKKKHPPRSFRTTRLAIKAQSVEILHPNWLPKIFPRQIPINVVRVTEIDPPQDEEPVEWTLLTTVPIEAPADVERVIDLYRGRWLIEDYFKALKTGCTLRKRLPETLKTALVMMAVLAPIAWQLLLLRYLERKAPTAPATRLFKKERLRVLRRFVPKEAALPPRASVRHVLTAIAKMGGHRKSNGPPGWQVLGRGFQRLLELEAGWRAAKEGD